MKTYFTKGKWRSYQRHSLTLEPCIQFWVGADRDANQAPYPIVSNVNQRGVIIEGKANSDLIAAAPDMFAALEICRANTFFI